MLVILIFLAFISACQKGDPGPKVHSGPAPKYEVGETPKSEDERRWKDQEESEQRRRRATERQEAEHPVQSEQKSQENLDSYLRTLLPHLSQNRKIESAFEEKNEVKSVESKNKNLGKISSAWFRKNASRNDFPESGIAAARKNLLEDWAAQKYEKVYESIGYLTNPWTGSLSDTSLKGITNEKGFIIKNATNTSDFNFASGTDNYRHRLRLLANELQGYTLSNTEKKVQLDPNFELVLDFLKGCLKRSANLSWGRPSELPETLLSYGEAAIKYLKLGKDIGMMLKIEMNANGRPDFSKPIYAGIDYDEKNHSGIPQGFVPFERFFTDGEKVTEATKALDTLEESY